MASLSWIHHGQRTSFSFHPLFDLNRCTLFRINKKQHVNLQIVRYSSEREAGEGSFVKSLDVLYPQVPCRICKGRGKFACDKCDGKGSLGRGGYQKKNPVNLDRIVGSKWTARETTFGWRHFIVYSKQRGSAKDWFLEMVATCDKDTHFWINSKNLKSSLHDIGGPKFVWQDRERWSMGWLQREELVNGSRKSKDASLCKACRGEGMLICTACDIQNGSKIDRVDIIEV
ncbi:uncharacterized protein LOC131045501 isoform X2 [Cryptomeria japonica]|uniref:uncharacterized protein LOC131045501 isoform X2 n=1 Tax=Cryptomeria japonica TaxID=3369 RepID=UPI0025AB78C8|nr:uncharacterized protein LOC131045501 isoform X2 [Cryptomeria japonica]